MKRIVSILTLFIIIGSIFNINVYSEEKYNEILKQDLKLIEYLDKNAEIIIKKDANLAQTHYIRKEGKTNEELKTSTLLNSSSMGTYGDILVSTSIDSGSIVFSGHSAIVSAKSSSITVESYGGKFSPIGIDGVQYYENTWANSSKAYLLGVRGADKNDYMTAALYSEDQVGKPYNWNYFDKTTTDRFYCSQLVWLAWLEAGIDVQEGSFFEGIVSPSDFIYADNTYIIKRNP